MTDKSAFQSWLSQDYSDAVPTDISDLISDQGVPDNQIISAANIIHRLSEMPWYTQEQLLEETELSKSELIVLNSLIRESDFFQNMIVHHGLGRKYWNTIIPYVQSGMIDKVLNYEYAFPLRLAFFPGMSCMYYCGFCGRNQNASYNPKEVLRDGVNRFKDIITNLPKNSTISISGGLEPLTNMGLGEIISHAKSLGHRVPLITNAHMLTPKYLVGQPGIWDLDSLRVSLYGIDDESTYFVTRHPKAYTLVRNNIIEFLKERNKRNSDLKLGLNYIILPENINTILPLLDYINDVNSNVNNGPGIDFLTIREDFGSVTEINDAIDKDIEGRKYHLDGLLSESQRKQLIEIFSEFNSRIEVECPDMHVDFGYAMVALGEGVIGKPLARVNGSKMRKSGYTQMSVAVDSHGDIFLYREAGFLDRPGNEKFIAGRIKDGETIETVLRKFLGNKDFPNPDNADSRFMDSYDHLMTLLVNQAESDMEIGIPFASGPVKVRCPEIEDFNINLSNNWYRDQKS